MLTHPVQAGLAGPLPSGDHAQPAGSRPARRPARRRLLDGPRRAVLHDDPRRPRGRRGQDRAARGRRDARLGSTLGRSGAGGGRGPDRGVLPRGQPEQARHEARSQAPRRRRGARPVARAWRCPRRELPRRRVRATRVRRRGAQRAQSTARPPGDHGVWASRAGRRPTRLRLRDPGRERAHVDHRRPGRRGWGTDQGRRRDQRRGQRDARSGGDPGRARRARARRDAGRGRGPADRCVAARLDAGQSRQPGAERLRDRRRPRTPGQCPPEHRPVRDVPDGRRRGRGGRRVGATVAEIVRRGRAAVAGRRSTLRDQRRPGRAAVGICGRCSARGSRHGRPRSG